MASKAGGNAPPAFRVVEGIKIPSVFEALCKRPMEEQVQRLKAMDMRPDDIILVAFPKSGTHWIWEVANMLLTGKAEYEKRAKEFVMMESSEIEKLEAESSPRIFNTHLPMHLLPQQIKQKKVTVIHVYRNVKDVMTSLYFHLLQTPHGKSTTFDDIENLFFSESEDSYFNYLKGMEEYRKSNPDVPFFTMSFEDTKEDPVNAIQSLGKFLGVEVSDQLVKDIAEATRFQKMKDADKQKTQRSFMEIKMYRKGQVGDWKNHLTVALSERLDARMKQLVSCEYRFRYTL